MGAINGEGKKYLGHYDPWLDHQKSELQAKIKWKKHPKLGQLFNESDPLSFVQTHEQFGITRIPDILRIKCNFDGQVVHDPRTTSEEQISITSIYPVKLHLASLRGKRTNIYEYLAAAQRTKFAVVPMHTAQEFQLFNTSVSLHGDWFSPAQDPDFEAMAAWWSGKADGKTIFYKMHKHLENHYKKWTGKKRETENMMNSINKRKKNEEIIQAPSYAAEVLQPFSYFYNDSMENQHHQQPLAKKARTKINTSTPSSRVIASSSSASMSSGMVINIEQTPPILHPEQPSANNFSYFSGQNAQSKFLQWKAPLESSNSTLGKRRCMACFDSGREDRMYTCPGRGGRGKCQFS